MIKKACLPKQAICVARLCTVDINLKHNDKVKETYLLGGDISFIHLCAGHLMHID